MKGIRNYIIEYGKAQSFQPNLLSIFLNPFYFIRRGLYKGIKGYAGSLQGRLLDFGCGRKPYRKLFQVQQYIGLDIAKSGHSHEFSEIDVFYDGRKIPFPDAHFDSVFSSEVFEHVFNLDDILAEISRVTKPGGQMLFTVPFVWSEHEVPYDFGRYTSFGVNHLMQKHGFEVVQLTKTSHSVEVVIQLFALYVFTLFQTKNRYVNTVFTCLFITPINLLGLVFSVILPKKKDLYFNNVVLARKL